MHSLIAPQAPSGYNRNISTLKIISAVSSRNIIVSVRILFIRAGARMLGKHQYMRRNPEHTVFSPAAGA
jgi:hypothetical protein